MESRPPFTTRVLPDAPGSSRGFTHLLPATRRTSADHIELPQPDAPTFPSFLARELLIPKLDAITSSMWMVGRPMPPRPLHHQLMLKRTIVIAEDMDLHLVWAKDSRLFLKPIPAWLLEPDFWKAHILPDAALAAVARGFLHSYAALIAYPSDFAIATREGLLPEGLLWAQWRELMAEVVESHRYEAVNSRFWYGELRLSRLNKIYQWRMGSPLRGYSRVAAHMVYADLIRDNFHVLAAVLGYVVIVLTAMQVGLGTTKLMEDDLFQEVSYGFTVFSIIGPLAGGAGIILVFMAMFISNWMATKSYEKRRFSELEYMSGKKGDETGHLLRGGKPGDHVEVLSSSIESRA